MKTIKHSTSPKKVSKACKRKEMEIELKLAKSDAWKIPKELLIKYGEDLLLMFEEDQKMVTVLKWMCKHKITHRKLNHYYKLCPELEEMIEEFKYLAGHRIFEKALYREADGNIATRGMGMYNEDYRKSEEWRNSLKKELTAAAQPTTINVITPDFPSSGKVPDRVKKDLDDTK